MKSIFVTYHCKPGQRDAFYHAITENGIDGKSRAENGNSRYEYFYSLDDPDTLFLAEAWADEESHAAHKASDTNKLLQNLKAEFCIGSDVVRHVE